MSWLDVSTVELARRSATGLVSGESGVDGGRTELGHPFVNGIAAVVRDRIVAGGRTDSRSIL